MKILNILIISLIAQASISYAKKEPKRSIQQILPAAIKTNTVGSKSFNSISNLPTTLANIAYQAQSSQPEAIAREYLLNNSTTFKLLNKHLQELQLTNIRQGQATTTVRFKQYYQGIEVYDADVSISYNKDKIVNYVSNSLKPVTNFKQFKTSNSENSIITIAMNYLGKGLQVKQKTISPVVYLKDNKYISTYLINIDTDSMQGNWELIIDAISGEILLAKDTNEYQNANGTIFDPDPLSSSGSNYAGNYRDNNDSTNNQLNAQMTNKNLELSVSGGMFFLKSSWAESIDLGSPMNGDFSQTNSNFNFNRSEASFEGVNTFYHIEKFMRYLNESLGLDVKPFQYSGGVKFDAHGVSEEDNSFYSLNSGTLQFGDGGVDDAEDADVIIHELGHGIHHWVTNGHSSSSEGLGEGTGDYFAQSYSRGQSNQIWNSNQAAYHYIYSWDGHNEYWPGRTTNYTETYPNGLVGQIHTDGQIWATCLMKIWDQIGQENTDKIVVEGLAMTGSNTNQKQAAQAVLQAAADLGMGQHLNTIKNTFNTCGYAVNIDSSISASVAFTGNSTTSTTQKFTATITGGVPPYKYAWDINNDTNIDGTEQVINVNYQEAFNGEITVTVTDAQNASSSSTINVNIKAAKIDAISAGDIFEVCGNGDQFADPGEKFKIALTMQNNGFATATNAYAVLTKNGGASGFSAKDQDSYGNTIGECGKQFIDISTTGSEMTLIDANPNDNFDANDEGVAHIDLPNAFNLYGKSVSQLSLSSNGYISSDSTETGIDFNNDCPFPSNPSTTNIQGGVSKKAKLMPLHNDLITQKIYYQHFSNCPRSSQLGANLSCDVFMYKDVDLFDSTNSTVEHFNFEAILYPTVNQWVYQYDGADFSSGGASIGLQSDNAADGASMSCDNSNIVSTQKAVCIFHKDNQPQASGSASTNINLETPFLTLGNLAVSQNTVKDILFSIPEDASCGASVGFDMQAAVYEEGFNKISEAIVSVPIGNNGSCQVVSNCLVTSANNISPTNGLWYNPKRSGNGNDMYFFEDGESPFMIYIQYTALENRSPIWYITGSDSYYQNNQSYNNIRKISYNGPYSSNTANQIETIVGESYTTLIDDENAIQTRTINGKFSADLLKVLHFSQDTTPNNRTGLWINQDQLGWGVTIATQGDTEVLVNYLYDNNGQPYWTLGVGNNNAVENINLDYFNSFCPHCPSVDIQTNTVGAQRINYASGSNATMETISINSSTSEHPSAWNKTNTSLQNIVPPDTK